MSSGYYPGDPSAWESAAEFLPLPWRPEWAVNDLRCHADRCRLPRERAPTLAALATRWGWTIKRVRTLVRAADQWTAATHAGDALGLLSAIEARRPANVDAARAREGHGRGTGGARGTTGEPAQSSEKGTGGAREGHGRGTHARGSSTNRPTETHTPNLTDPSHLRPATAVPLSEPPQEHEPCTPTVSMNPSTTAITPVETPPTTAPQASASLTAGPTVDGEDSRTEDQTAPLLPLALTPTATTPQENYDDMPTPQAVASQEARPSARLGPHGGLVDGSDRRESPRDRTPAHAPVQDPPRADGSEGAMGEGEASQPDAVAGAGAGRGAVLTPADPLPALWLDLDALRLGWTPGRSRKMGKELRRHLSARVDDHGAEAVRLVWAWVWQSSHKRAEFLRGHDDATTLLRPGNLAKYLAWAQEWDDVGRPQAARPVAAPAGKAYPSPSEASQLYQLIRRSSGTPPESYHPDPVVSGAIRAASQALGGWRGAGQMTTYDSSRAYAQGGPFEVAYTAAISTSAKQAAK